MTEIGRLRSAVWSSETLFKGMGSVSEQPDGLLVKTEEDEALLNEYHVPLMILSQIFSCIFSMAIASLLENYLPFAPSKAPPATLTQKPRATKALQQKLQELESPGLDEQGLSESQVEGDQGLAASASVGDENDQIDDGELSMSLQALAPRST